MSSNPRRSLLEDSLAAIERFQARLDAVEAAKHEPIAIIGAGCRYPGGVETPEQLWTVLRDGIDAVTEVPADRWNIDAYYDPNPRTAGKMITRRGGFLRQVDRFDPGSFGISPREAKTLDPQQRLLLETALEALESAALAPEKLVGSSTAVFVGITTNDYAQLVRAGGPGTSDVYSATGTALNAAAGRIAFTFGFQGPTAAVDTACSSSLVSVHLACRALRNGEADLALAGGVNVVLSPDAMVLYSEWGMLAPDGRCKTFDAAADGFVRAEGCAMIALKRLSSAIADGDPILAVIRGSAVNQDGRSSGLTVPNGPAQESVLRHALADAGLTPADIDYVEAHGTGTKLGDPIELEALGAVMGAGRDSRNPLLVGSIKTNLGHTEAASGLAGLLKVVLSLRNEAIPPHLHFTAPNPGIPWDTLPLAVPTSLTPWPASSRPRRAGVSSFGFSGTNAHVIIEEAPRRAEVARASGPRIVPLSARSGESLRELARRQHEDHAAHPDHSFDDRAATLALGRAQLSHRAAIVCENEAQLGAALDAVARGEESTSVAKGVVAPGARPRIAMLFTGQGSQYAGMAKGLYERESVFHDALDRCDAILTPLLGKSLASLMWGADAHLIDQTAFTQPALFALEWSLAELWRSWGVTPSVVLGHSVGEYVAACVAGVMSLDAALALITERARLMQALPSGGAMTAIFAPLAEVEPAVVAAAEGGAVISVAAVNGPDHVVVSGAAIDVDAIGAQFAARNIRAQRLSVSHAFHSALLDPMLDQLESATRAIQFSTPRITLVSNLTGAPWPMDSAPEGNYWRRHARQPVRFAAGIEAARAAGCDVFLEVGPSPTLATFVTQVVSDKSVTVAHSLRRNRDDATELYGALAALHVRGVPIDWAAVYAGRGGARIQLPTYPFQRERYWINDAEPAPAPAPGHPLLGSGRELASNPATYVWEQEISLATLPWVRDHSVQHTPIVPATAYVEMAIQAIHERTGTEGVVLRSIENHKPLLLRDRERRRIQSTLTALPDGSANFRVDSRTGDRGAWTTHVTATLAPIASVDTQTRADLAALRARCSTSIEGPAFYAALAAKGNQWGPCFQGMERAWIGEGEVVARIRVVDAIAGEVSRYRFHPALSDSSGHALVASRPIEGDESATGGAFVGGGIGEVRFHRHPRGNVLWSHARLRTPPDGAASNLVFGDLHIYDEDGSLISETLSARLWFLDADAKDDASIAPADWFHSVRWEDTGAATPGPRAAARGRWLILDDARGIGGELARQVENATLVRHGTTFELGDGTAVIRPSDRDDYSRLLEANRDVTAIVNLWSVDRSWGAVHARELGAESVVNLMHACTATGSRPRFWLVTSDAQAVLPSDGASSPLGATLWGLGRTLSAEHPECWGGLIDIDARSETSSAARFIANEIRLGAADDKLAQRADRRLAPRLVREAPVATRPVHVSSEGTYLLTGGLGGIALAMARWLVDRGARHLVLVGRTPLPAREAWTAVDPHTPNGKRIAIVRELEAAGAHIDVAAIDIAKPGALSMLVAERAAAGRPAVRGAIHAAGVLRFQPLDQEDARSLESAFAAKVEGATELAAALSGSPLDFLVFCSSTSALLPSPLLGAYAAGNAFLDSFADQLRSRGVNALSVNWGTWGEVGMAVDSGQPSGREMLRGVGTISTNAGLAALAKLIASDATHSIVMPVDWAAMAEAYPHYAADPFFRDLVAARDGAAPESDIRASLAAASASERPIELGVWLRGEAARVLGFAPDRLDITQPLATMGFDSLMAVQLRNRVDAELSVSLPLLQYLQGPSVEQLTATVLDALPAGDAQLAVAASAPAVVEWDEGSI